MISTLRHQRSQVLVPRSYLDVAAPTDLPSPDGPAIASKTGSAGGCRVETGLLYLPGNGGTVAYFAAADRSMTALAEGNEILGRLRDHPGPLAARTRSGTSPPAWLSQ